MRALLGVLLACGCCAAQVTLERLRNGSWQEIPAATVVDSGEQIRFRFRAAGDGFLYVVNQGSSGTRALLFPSLDAGRDNTLRAGADRLVPDGEHVSFRVSGPEGLDVLYFISSPVALSDPDRRALTRPVKRPPVLLPRCDDGILRARGECQDTQAGLRPPSAPNIIEFRLAHR